MDKMRAPTAPKSLAGCGNTIVVCLVHLVFLVYLVALVCLVQLVSLMQPNKPDRREKPDRPNNDLHTLAGLFSILLENALAYFIRTGAFVSS